VSGGRALRILTPRLWAVLAFLAVLGLGPTARAQIGSERYAAIVTDARTGTILAAANPDEQRYPASLTKMMTVYLAFEALRDGRTSLSETIRVSSTAAAMPPSRLGLTPGMTLTVEQAILALVTKSANDAAAALGEHLGGGSEIRFAQMMTLRARALGMTRTTFRNASGLPDPDQVTTARDMALLGRRLMADHADRFEYFSAPHFVFRGRTHWNHNRLLQEYDGTDGIKTGFVNDSGFNLVASARRDGVRLVAAVFGGRTGRERDRHMMALLDQGFAQMGVGPSLRGSNSLMARAQEPQVLSSARAATPPMRTAAAMAARTQARATAPVVRPAPQLAAPRPALRRPAETRLAATRPPARIEQGDSPGRPSTRAATAARAPVRPVSITRPTTQQRRGG